MLKEISRTQEQSSDRLAVNLFPVSDTLEFCIRHRPDFESEELKDNLEAKGAFDGLEAAKRQFVAAMRSVNINEIVPQVGDQFDPMMHNACFEVDVTSSTEPGQIGIVIKTGWSKNNTLLRAADVGVAKSKETPLPLALDEEDPPIDDGYDDELDSDDES